MASSKRCFQIRQHFIISSMIKCLGKEPRKKSIIFNKCIKKKRQSINEHQGSSKFFCQCKQLLEEWLNGLASIVKLAKRCMQQQKQIVSKIFQHLVISFLYQLISANEISYEITKMQLCRFPGYNIFANLGCLWFYHKDWQRRLYKPIKFARLSPVRLLNPREYNGKYTEGLHDKETQHKHHGLDLKQKFLPDFVSIFTVMFWEHLC